MVGEYVIMRVGFLVVFGGEREGERDRCADAGLFGEGE